MESITDKEKKFLERLVFYTATCMLLIILVVLTCLIIYFVFKVIAGKMDEAIIGGIIGAFGGIAGGFLTLIGVRYTITLQKRKEFVDAFPKKLLLSDNVSEEMLIIIEKIEQLLSDDDLTFDSTLAQISDSIRHFMEEKLNQVKADAAGVGPEWFDIVKRFEFRLIMIYTFTLEYYYEESLDEYDNELYEWSSSLRDIDYIEFLNISIELEEKYKSIRNDLV